jgi:hypothetical protein
MVRGETSASSVDVDVRLPHAAPASGVRSRDTATSGGRRVNLDWALNPSPKHGLRSNGPARELRPLVIGVVCGTVTTAILAGCAVHAATAASFSLPAAPPPTEPLIPLPTALPPPLIPLPTALPPQLFPLPNIFAPAPDTAFAPAPTGPLPTPTGQPLPTPTGPLPTPTGQPLPTPTGPLPTPTGQPLPTPTGAPLPTPTGAPLPTPAG